MNPQPCLSRRRLLKYLAARDEEKAAAEMETHLKALQRHYLVQQTEIKQVRRAS